MKYEKGVSGNVHGRPKGAKNKTTLQIKQAVTNLVSDNLDKLKEDIAALEPKDRINAIIALLKYSIPIQSKLSINDFSNMDSESLTEIANHILNSLDNE